MSSTQQRIQTNAEFGPAERKALSIDREAQRHNTGSGQHKGRSEGGSQVFRLERTSIGARLMGDRGDLLAQSITRHLVVEAGE